MIIPVPCLHPQRPWTIVITSVGLVEVDKEVLDGSYDEENVAHNGLVAKDED